MGILSKPKAPAAVDPMSGAQQAGQLSLQQQQELAKNYWGQGTKTGPAGGISTDPNTGQQTQAFSPELQGAYGNFTSALGGQSGNVPTGFNFDNLTPQAVANGDYENYARLTAPQRDQERNAMNTMLAERGMPLGNEVDNNVRGNFLQKNFLADNDAAQRAWNSSYDNTMKGTQTAIAQGMAPGQLAGQTTSNLGLMQGLLPGYNNPYAFTGGIDPGQVYSNITAANQKSAQEQYNANMQGYGNMIGGGLGLLGKGLTAPMTGGASLLGMGMSGLGGLFNNGGSLPWANSPNYNAYGSLNGGVGGIA